MTWKERLIELYGIPTKIKIPHRDNSSTEYYTYYCLPFNVVLDEDISDIVEISIRIGNRLWPFYVKNDEMFYVTTPTCWTPKIGPAEDGLDVFLKFLEQLKEQKLLLTYMSIPWAAPIIEEYVKVMGKSWNESLPI